MGNQNENNGRNRNHVRRHLLLHLNVNDTAKNDVLGRLGNISMSGVLLIVKNRIRVGTRLEITIDIPEQLKVDAEHLDLKVETRWIREADNRDIFEVGCSIIYLRDREEEIINALINRLDFSDGTRKIFLKK